MPLCWWSLPEDIHYWAVLENKMMLYVYWNVPCTNSKWTKKLDMLTSFHSTWCAYQHLPYSVKNKKKQIMVVMKSEIKHLLKLFDFRVLVSSPADSVPHPWAKKIIVAELKRGSFNSAGCWSEFCPCWAWFKLLYQIYHYQSPEPKRSWHTQPD